MFLSSIKKVVKKFVPETIAKATIREEHLHSQLSEYQNTIVSSLLERLDRMQNHLTYVTDQIAHSDFWKEIYRLGQDYRNAKTSHEKEIVLSFLNSEQSLSVDNSFTVPLSDILFISFPYWDVISPFSAVPSLCGYLNSQGFTTAQIDLGILSFHYRFKCNFEPWQKKAQFFLSEEFFKNKVEKHKINHCKSLGAKILYPCFTEKVTDEGVVLRDGTLLDADTVIISIGDRPMFDFLAPNMLDERGMLKLNQYKQTVLDNVFAAGDAIKQGLFTNAIADGNNAAKNVINLLTGKELDTFEKKSSVVSAYPDVFNYGRFILRRCA